VARSIVALTFFAWRAFFSRRAAFALGALGTGGPFRFSRRHFGLAR